MELSAKNIINKYGSTVRILSENNTVTTKGIIRPLYHRNRYRAVFKRLPSGIYDNRHQYAIFPPDTVLKRTGGEKIECSGEKYRVNSNGVYSVRDKALYVWAVLSACTDSTEDDYDEDN